MYPEWVEIAPGHFLNLSEYIEIERIENGKPHLVSRPNQKPFHVDNYVRLTSRSGTNRFLYGSEAERVLHHVNLQQWKSR